MHVSSLVGRGLACTVCVASVLSYNHSIRWSSVYSFRTFARTRCGVNIYPAYAQILWKRCHNCGANVAGPLAPLLRQHPFIDTFEGLSNIVWMSRKCCVNIVPTLYFEQNSNVATTLLQHWPMLWQDCTNICELCGNVTPHHWAPMLIQQATSAPNVGNQPWGNIA